MSARPDGPDAIVQLADGPDAIVQLADGPDAIVQLADGPDAIVQLADGSRSRCLAVCCRCATWLFASCREATAP